MRNLAESPVPGLRFQLAVVAHVKPLRMVALAADQVMKMLIGSRQFKKLVSVFQDHPLNDADGLKGLKGPVNSDQIGFRQAGPLGHFGRRSRPVEGEERAENPLALAGDPQRTGTQALGDRLKQLDGFARHMKTPFINAARRWRRQVRETIVHPRPASLTPYAEGRYLCGASRPPTPAMDQPIDTYLRTLEAFGRQAETYFLEGDWARQRLLQSQILKAADRLLDEPVAAGGHPSELSGVHAAASRILSGASSKEPLSLPRGPAGRSAWQPFHQWIRSPEDRLAAALGSARLLEDWKRFTAAKGLTLSAEPQIFPQAFFRNRRAYLMARNGPHNTAQPMLLAITRTQGELVLDAVLVSEAEITPVFEFSRSILLPRLSHSLDFLPLLEALLPGKPRWQLLLNIGFTVLGKALLLVDLREHLRWNPGRLVEAPGTRGMVMIVFHLPGFPVVFKVIKDCPDPPKSVGRREVLRKYRLVAEQDRVGRLADSHLFENLPFPLEAFDPALLRLLRERAPAALRCHRETVFFREVLVERTMFPLDLLLEDPQADWKALLHEYADAVEDLARANVFPGDLLPKNFGVTRFGRVVFYDYDEVDLLTACTFRRLPPEDSAEALSSGPNDVFPEEWPRFLLRNPEHRAWLESARPALFDPAFWNACRQQYLQGDFVDLFPYRSQRGTE